MDELLIAFGGAIKALGDGKVGGYLVRFTGPDQPDLEGDFFTPDTDFDLEGKSALSVYYQHGQDATLKNRRIGRGKAAVDDVGLWIEAQLELRDEYEKAIYEMVESGKVGWSSGAVAHLVQREKSASAWHIKSWPIGEASITPTPAAGPDMTKVLPLKSLQAPVPEAAKDTATNEATATGDTDIQPIKQEVTNMSDEQKQEKPAPAAVDLSPVLDALKGIGDTVKALNGRIEQLEKEPVNGTPPAAKNVNLNPKTGLGDNWTKSFTHYLRTGDGGGLGVPMGGEVEIKASNNTDMNITTAADGGDLVPRGFFQQVIARRDESMLAGVRLPVRRIPGVGTTVDVPIDNEADGEFISTGEVVAFDRDAPAVSKKALTLVKYTKKIEISYELLDDNDVNLLAFLADFVGRGMAKTHNNLLLTEVAANGTSFKTFASATAIAFGEPEDIVGSNDLAPYLEDEGAAAWVTRSSTFWDILSLTGNDRQYGNVAMNVAAGGTRWNLLGYPVYHSQKAAAVAASAKSVYFGNWRYVGWREAPGLTFLRDPYTLAGDGQVRLLYHFRTVYGVLQAEAIGYGTHPT